MDPISHIHITSDPRSVPPDAHVFARTIENADADLYPNRFFGKSTRRYLVIERQKNAPELVVDIVLIDDDEAIPPGFHAVQQTYDSREDCFKNQKLCIQKSSFHSAQRHVVDMVVTNQKDFYRQNQYTYLGEINNLCLCFKSEIKAQSVSRQPVPAARTVLPVQVESPRRQAPQPPKIKEVCPLMGLQYKLSDCIQTGGSGDSAFDLAPIRIKTRDDILAEYYYDFSTEHSVMQKSDAVY